MAPEFLLLLFPLIWPFIAKRIWNAEITWSELGLNIVIIVVLCLGVYHGGKYGQTVDTEIWNGVVNSKKIIDDHYVESYDCNCREVCSGSGNQRSCSTVCNTCYEDHYTREWIANTSIGRIQFDKIDTTWKMKRNRAKPPAAYNKCIPGEPTSLAKTYTNYVQAVPKSLFNDNSSLAEQYAGKIPAYPRVYNFYRINRVINVGSLVPANVQKDLNGRLNVELITLGKLKQVNIIVIFTNVSDPSYRYAIENAWLGGKKNDVVVIIGTQDGKTVQWADVMTWALNSGNELFHVKMRDGLKQTPIESQPLSQLISSTITKHYDRPQMADYEYLKSEIKPPNWVMIIAVLISIVGSILLTALFHKIDVDFFKNRRYR